ncbi:MAG: tRNA (adenosine(37)-N6)-threonylcarbamoyltransferase complex transferase subunit TsaD [Acidobacteria bacterium]|jgi:N6-L-threonylcarbamoyladenine synthase|nr:tRNA (adenosine(37)-N6)-threonylcarbamoyltransferase complex transferase subunit TsaD [Acidobacteriota bacterium]
MNILGIETSCDETAAAVVCTTGDTARPWKCLSNVIASQFDVHREWGGVVPELASRQHVRDICGVVERALADAACAWTDIDALAVTQGPGLVGSLLVGVSFAKAAAASLGRPVIPVHHLAGHIESIWLDHGDIPLPAVVLVVSGGHTSLYEVRSRGTYRLVGRTRDDAAGEAYDKVARLLGLGYPGGPVVDRRARHGNDRAVALPRPRFTGPSRSKPHLEGMTEFSFSGLKSAAVRLLQQRMQNGPLSDAEVDDVCASFQRVVVETLVDRTFHTAAAVGAKSVGIAGGVSANSRLRADAIAYGRERGVPVFVPALSLSTDNAAMIAAAGLRRLELGEMSDLGFNADPSLKMGK